MGIYLNPNNGNSRLQTNAHMHVTSNRNYNNEYALHAAIFLAYIYTLNSYIIAKKLPASRLQYNALALLAAAFPARASSSNGGARRGILRAYSHTGVLYVITKTSAYAGG